jgi:hypothetical protein
MIKTVATNKTPPMHLGSALHAKQQAARKAATPRKAAIIRIVRIFIGRLSKHIGYCQPS